MSRKSKKHGSKNAGRNANLGVKKAEKPKVRKNTIVKALSEKSLSLTALPVSTTEKKKKKQRKGKATNPQTKLPLTLPLEKTNQPQKEGVSTVGGGKNKKRKRSKNKGASSEQKSPEKLSVITEAKSQSSKQSGNKRKRRNRKKAPAEVTTTPKPGKSNPVKKAKLDRAAEEASSDSEAELISADWGLAADSDEENDKKDIHTSEEDVDEVVPDDEEIDDDDDEESDDDEANDSDVDVNEACVKKESVAKTTVGKRTIETEKSEKKKPKENKGDATERPNAKVTKQHFLISEKAPILAEMLRRIADFDARCLYVSPIPTNCTFDMLKKFIPKMKSCRFFVKPKSTKLRTFVFVDFADPETAAREKLSISGRLFASQPMRAELRVTQRADGEAYTVDRIDFSRIQLSGLASTVNQMDIKRVFPTAESIRLPMSTQNFNFGYATLNYVSHEVALDAFSQCHGFVLQGNPISVNFSFKPPEKKLAGVAVNDSSTKSGAVNQLKGEPQPAQRVGKVIIQPMTSTDIKGERGVLAKDLEASESSTKIKGKGAESKLAAKDNVYKKASTSILSEMIKRLKERTNENGGTDEDDATTNDESDEEESSDKSDDDMKVKDDNKADDSDDRGSDDSDSDDSDSDDSDSDDSDSDDSDSDDDDVDDDVNNDVDDDVDDDDDDEVVTKGNMFKVDLGSVSTTGSGEEVEMLSVFDSDEEELDASLVQALIAQRTCAKALKAPGAKRNWKTTDGKKRPPNSMPKMLPVPTKRRK